LVRLFILRSSLAHVKTRKDTDEMLIIEESSWRMISPTVVTEYPSDRETFSLQLPFKNGRNSEHLFSMRAFAGWVSKCSRIAAVTVVTVPSWVRICDSVTQATSKSDGDNTNCTARNCYLQAGFEA
jgi:hypothetical protein